MMTADDFAALKALVVSDEGNKPYIYDDATGLRIRQGSTVVGHPTFGNGTNLDEWLFPQSMIDEATQQKIDELYEQVTKSLPWTQELPASAMKAILSIAYWSGFEGLLGFRKMLAFAQNGQFVQAANEIVNSELAPARAQRLATLMRGTVTV
jgi:lysozyme